LPSFNPEINKIIDTPLISSAILKNQRKVSIYYPPSYFDNKYKKYEILLLHDGQNLFDPSKAAFGVAWKCQNTANTLIG
jgi:predicted alpha/beta superfamily hydrolase